MRTVGWLACLIVAGVMAGCGSSLHDTTAPGPVDKDLYKDAQADNAQRLAGEDHQLVSPYKNPFDVPGLLFDDLIGHPISNFFDYITNDNAAYAARKMVDPTSADNRRKGTLRLVTFSFARKGYYLKVYATEARDDEDYTVRAAGLRALNRSRAKGYTLLFIAALSEKYGEPLVRLEAADCLGNMPDPQAIPVLIDRLEGVDPATEQPEEPNVDVRIACADALRCYHTQEVMRALINVLTDRDFGVAWQARQSLELLTGEDFMYDPKAWLNYLAEQGSSG